MMEVHSWKFDCDFLCVVSDDQILAAKRLEGRILDSTELELWTLVETSDSSTWTSSQRATCEWDFDWTSTTTVYPGGPLGILFSTGADDWGDEELTWWKFPDDFDCKGVALSRHHSWRANPNVHAVTKWIAVRPHHDGFGAFDDRLRLLHVLSVETLGFADIFWKTPNCLFAVKGYHWSCYDPRDDAIVPLVEYQNSFAVDLSVDHYPRFALHFPAPRLLRHWPKSDRFDVMELVDPCEGYHDVQTVRHLAGELPFFEYLGGCFYVAPKTKRVYGWTSSGLGCPMFSVQDVPDALYFGSCAWTVPKREAVHPVATRYRPHEPATTLLESAVAERTLAFLNSFPDERSRRLMLALLPNNAAHQIRSPDSERLEERFHDRGAKDGNSRI